MNKNLGDEISLKEIILSIKDWFLFLFSKWIYILLVGLTGAIIGLTFAYFSKVAFTAELTFALEEKNGSASGLGNLASEFGFNIGGGNSGAFAGDNIMELMKSQFLIEKTLLSEPIINNKKILLINYYTSLGKKKEGDKNNLGPKVKFDNTNRELFTRAQDSVLGKIARGIKDGNLSVFKVDKKLNLITVRVNSLNEMFSKLFCEYLVKNVSQFYVDTKTANSKKNVVLLENRVDSVKIELDNAMYGRAAFSDQNQGLIRQRAAVPKLKQELRVQMLSNLYAELIKNLEFSRLSLMREEPLIQIIDTPKYPLKIQKLGKTKAVILGGMISTLIAVFFFFFKELIRRNFK